ncbi:galactokinase [Fulvivirgaceae bacterium BMA12]|uniref:Galactokinase n=1 Tax=Agaribacillus aureus TaxID=3051825 RepID=A0ABT8L7V7_9BACT|nr:galactokinase [Fulvivirgaceae bacterium BMA12]
MFVKKVEKRFKSLFSTTPEFFRSPGRINLIGEHTDYNNGYVMPATVDRQMVFAVAKNQSDVGRVHSLNLDESFEFNVDGFEESPISWANYVLGVVNELRKDGLIIGGFDCVFGGDIPMGAGMASSVAIQCGVGYFLNHLFELGLSRLEIAQYALKAENEYVGIPGSIPAHFANMFGKTNHFIKLDCQSLDHEFIEMNRPNYRIILFDSQVKNSQMDVHLSRRKKECEEGVAVIKKYFPEVSSLRDCRSDMLLKCKDELGPILYRRCDFVVRENQRVVEGSEDIVKNRMEAFGQKMFDSHLGLKNDYEVSCDPLDFLVNEVTKYKSVLGARMTGPGFGGCTINLVKDYDREEFISEIQKRYKKYFRKDLLVYKVKIAKGTGLVV